jgi:hypothetical protein
VALPAPQVAAQPFAPYAQVDGWTVWINDATRGCFMEARRGDLIVQMGTQGGADFGFIAAYAEGDVGIRQGEEIAVVIDIDGEGFGGIARGVQRTRPDGTLLEGAVTISRSIAFAEALADGQRMAVLGENGTLVEIDLSGTAAAITAVLDCQTSLDMER